MSKHWTPDDVGRRGIPRRQGRQDAPSFAGHRVTLLCAAALFGVAVAIVESLLP